MILRIHKVHHHGKSLQLQESVMTTNTQSKLICITIAEQLLVSVRTVTPTTHRAETKEKVECLVEKLEQPTQAAETLLTVFRHGE
jgi:hypothetical protein